MDLRVPKATLEPQVHKGYKGHKEILDPKVRSANRGQLARRVP